MSAVRRKKEKKKKNLLGRRKMPIRYLTQLA
jgi:hypothetical protein